MAKSCLHMRGWIVLSFQVLHFILGTFLFQRFFLMDRVRVGGGETWEWWFLILSWICAWTSFVNVVWKSNIIDLKQHPENGACEAYLVADYLLCDLSARIYVKKHVGPMMTWWVAFKHEKILRDIRHPPWQEPGLLGLQSLHFFFVLPEFEVWCLKLSKIRLITKGPKNWFHWCSILFWINLSSLGILGLQALTNSRRVTLWQHPICPEPPRCRSNLQP